jgi:hypothetical protein
MPTIDEALVSLVSSLAGVTSIIGSNPMRFFPVRLSGTTYPAVTYQRIDSNGVYSHGGSSHLQMSRYQLTLWTRNYLENKQLELAFKADTPTGLNGYRGTVLGVYIQRIFCVDGITDFEPTTQIHQRTLDLMIDYTE